MAVVGLIAAGTVVAISGSSSTTSSSPAISRTAARFLQASLNAARRAGSFHYVSNFTSQGSTQHTVGDAGPDSGRQVITIGSHSFTVLVIGTACYFQGDANTMVAQLGVSAAAATSHAGQWIALAPSDGPYQSVYAAVTAPSALSDNIAFKPQHDLGTSTVGTRSVQSIGGAMTNFSASGQTQQARGTAEFDAAVARPHVPVRYVERGVINGQQADFTMTFSHWGERVGIVAPPGALSFSSLSAGTPGPSGPPGSTTLI